MCLGSQRLKANTSKELTSRNFHPHGRKKMEGQKIARNLIEATRLSCVCFAFARLQQAPKFCRNLRCSLLELDHELEQGKNLKFMRLVHLPLFSKLGGTLS